MTALIVPKDLGYAGIAGVPLQNGLFAAAAGAIIYALFCTSRQISTGPSSGLAAVAGGAVLVTKIGGQEAAQLTMVIGTQLPDYDEVRYRRAVVDLVGAFQGVAGEQIQAGRTLVRLARLSAEHGVRPAPELTVMGRALLQLDQSARCLDAGFDPNEIVRSFSDSLMRRHMLKKLSPARSFLLLIAIR